MRFRPFFSSFVFTLSSFTRHRAAAQAQHPLRPLTLRSGITGMPLFGGLFSSSSSSSSSTMSYPDQRSPDEWRAVLNKEQFRVLREQATERAGTGKYDKHYPDVGVYTCAGCNAPLYKANHKFDSGCGWPAYFDSIPGAVTRHEEGGFMPRTEIVCSNCGGHLGHVFKGEGFPTPTNERHCVNSISLNFSQEDKAAGSGENKA